jgi:hypothetical protein
MDVVVQCKRHDQVDWYGTYPSTHSVMGEHRVNTGWGGDGGGGKAAARVRVMR